MIIRTTSSEVDSQLRLFGQVLGIPEDSSCESPCRLHLDVLVAPESVRIEGLVEDAPMQPPLVTVVLHAEEDVDSRPVESLDS